MKKNYKMTDLGNYRLLLMAMVLAFTACNKPRFDVLGESDVEKAKAKHRKVLIIGLSGVRGDALKLAEVPNIKKLLPNAIYSYDALTEAPTLAAPGWSSTLTGVWGAKHGVVADNYSGNKFDQYPMLFKHIKDFNPDLKTIAISSTTAINTSLVSNADAIASFENDDLSVKNNAVMALADTTADVMFVNFGQVNTVGVQMGFSPEIPEYMQAITNVDTYIGELMTAVDGRSSILNEDWLIIISSDHGGTLLGTGGNEYEARNIFTIFYNKYFKASNIVKSQTNTTFLKVDQAIGVQCAYSDSSLYDFSKYPKFTYEMRVRVDGNLASDPPLVANKAWASGVNPGWGLFVTGQKWKFNAGDGISANRRDINPLATTPPLNDAKWHHIAVTVDKAGFAKTYQDGVFIAQLNVAAVTKWNNPAFATTIAIMEDATRNIRNQYSYRMKINFADVRIWSTVIDEETMAIFAKCDTTVTPEHPYYENLIGWWKGNDAKGDVLKNYSLKNSNLKIMGTPKWEETGKNLCNQVIQADVPKAVDITAQVYSWLRIPIKPEWNIDGKVWVNN